MTTFPPEPKPGPQPGDWVRVWAQAADTKGHPDDLVVRLTSHNEDYEAPVRKEHICPTDDLPPDVAKCTALFEYPGGPSGALTLCVRHHGHSDLHADVVGNLYGNEAIVGYMEDA